MSPKYTHAIVARISEALLESGPFDLKLAKRQHEQYCTLLRDIGLDVIELPPDDMLPEGVFVENCAVICNGVALICRSNNPKRRREAVSGSTNEEGVRAVAMAYPEYPVTPIRVNGSKRLKYYVTMAGPDVLCVSKSAPCQEIVKRMEREASFTYQKLTLPEETAANMLYINGTIVHRSPTEIPDAYKTLKEKIDIPTRNINISEFSQYSSGLTSSCLLLRRWKSIRSI
ncbi:GL18337 [Drosophila persimilis]|uniref:GL18337 n=1 Tax=Drosophila persimilis TaxID=7234 RepID=B4H4I7_DROPE|nr:GL18337 [Drosophila persimilis]